MAKALSLEESFQKLEGILDRMENEKLTLDESFKLYKEGIKLVENCNLGIDKVEKQIFIINEKGEMTEDNGEF